MDTMPLSSRRFQFRRWHLAAAVLLCLPLLGAVGVAGYFQLSSQTTTLRGSLMKATGGEWDKKFAVRVGACTMMLARFGSSFFHLPPEPKAALETLHSGEVGIYELRRSAQVDPGQIFARTDRDMARQGMIRIVGVVNHGDIVGVYMPRKKISWRKFSCAVMVLHDRQLIVASASGNPAPLLELARSHLGNRLNWLSNEETGTPFAAIGFDRGQRTR